MKMKFGFVLLAALSFASAASAEMCVYQLYSTMTGQIVSTFRDNSCYQAEDYCSDARREGPTAPDLSYAYECKKPEDRVQSNTAIYRLFFRGQIVGTYYATRYHHSHPQYLSVAQASSACTAEQRRRTDAAPSSESYDWIYHSHCTTQM